MISNSEEVMARAMALPPDDRAVLADKLLNSFDSLQRRDIDVLWAEEAERRIRQIENGEVELIPGEDVFKEIREKLIS